MTFSENKIAMMDDIIKDYGFESKQAIWFCGLAEHLTESQLLNAYIVLKAHIIAEED